MSIRNYQLPWAIAITALIVSSPSPSAGQHSAALKAHIFWTIEGLYTLAYEQAFNRHVSAELSVQAGHYIDVRPNRWEDYEVTGIGVVGAMRYYPFTKKAVAPHGFFGYAAMRYVDFNEQFLYVATGQRYEAGGNIINVGGGIGYKFAYRRVGLEAFVGWGAGRLKRQGGNNIPEYYRLSIEQVQEHFPQLDVALCYMFSPFFKG